MEAPKTPFEVRRRALGFRGVQVVALVNEWHQQRGTSPSYREIAESLGLDGKGHACNIARRAENAGYLKREGSGRNRRLRPA